MLAQTPHAFSTSILIVGADDHFFSYDQLPGSALELAVFQSKGSGKTFLYVKSLVQSTCPKDPSGKGGERVKQVRVPQIHLGWCDKPIRKHARKHPVDGKGLPDIG